MSHSPGPWHTGGIFNPDSDHPTANVWSATPPGKQSGEIIAQYVSLDDARLIAAAPDFLEALKSCQYEIFACLREESVRKDAAVLSALQTAYDAASSALSKAEGM